MSDTYVHSYGDSYDVVKYGEAATTTKMQPSWHAMPAGPLSRRAACSGGRRKSLSASLSSSC